MSKFDKTKKQFKLLSEVKDDSLTKNNKKGTSQKSHRSHRSHKSSKSSKSNNSHKSNRSHKSNQSNRSNSSAKSEVNVNSENSINRKIGDNFVLISADKLQYLKKGNYIKYVRRDKQNPDIYPGGYLQGSPYKSKKTGEKMLWIKTSMKSNAKSFYVKLKDIKYLFKQIDNSNLAETQLIVYRLQKIIKKLDELEKRMTILENKKIS